MLAVLVLVLAVGVKVAVRVRPEPESALNVPPLTTTSPDDPFQVKVEPGSSLKVKVIVAVSPTFKVETLLVMAKVGAVVSMVTLNPEDAELRFPAVSVALAVSV